MSLMHAVALLDVFLWLSLFICFIFMHQEFTNREINPVLDVELNYPFLLFNALGETYILVYIWESKTFLPVTGMLYLCLLEEHGSPS